MTAKVVGAEDSAAGKSSLSQCFSGLAWVWDSFLRLSRVGGPELDFHGGTAQGTIIGLPGVKSLQGQVRRGTEEGFGHSAKFSPSSCQQDYSIWLWQGMGEGNSAGRACEELTLPASRAQPHEVGGSSALGGLAMGARWVCWQQEIQKSGQPGSDGKPHSATAAGLQITERLRSTQRAGEMWWGKMCEIRAPK